jgi:uncharacterized protein YndB with AHSA1/START domain
MTANRHGTAVISFPSDLEIEVTRKFDAPIALVFDVLTKPEHVRKWGATPPDRMTECSIDLRVGGGYSSSLVTPDGAVCSFHGTYLEVDPPNRTVETWLFDGWPDAEAIETWQLHETDGVTTVTMSLQFRDQAGRAHYPAKPPDTSALSAPGGFADSLDAIEDILESLAHPHGTSSSGRSSMTLLPQDPTAT